MKHNYTIISKCCFWMFLVGCLCLGLFLSKYLSPVMGDWQHTLSALVDCALNSLCLSIQLRLRRVRTIEHRRIKKDECKYYSLFRGHFQLRLLFKHKLRHTYQHNEISKQMVFGRKYITGLGKHQKQHEKWCDEMTKSSFE